MALYVLICFICFMYLKVFVRMIYSMHDLSLDLKFMRNVCDECELLKKMFYVVLNL